jgi:hypothetical protein
MKNRKSQIVAMALLGVGAVSALGGCVAAREPVPATAGSPTVVISSGAPAQRVYTYREGRYELRGEGTSASPYYWVWIPAGATVTTLPPPPVVPHEVVPSASPATLSGSPSTQRVYTYPQGRYELRGDGTAASPHHFVWIPAGVTVVPPPPPLPR